MIDDLENRLSNEIEAIRPARLTGTRGHGKNIKFRDAVKPFRVKSLPPSRNSRHVICVRDADLNSAKKTISRAKWIATGL